MTKYCPGCGAKLKDWHVFCEKCGVQITDTPEYKPGYEEPLEEPNYEEYSPQSDFIQTDRPSLQDNTHIEKNIFLTMLETIENEFDPRVVKSKDDFKNQLILFLNTKFSNEIKGQGHTQVGGEIDIVIDGTFAIKTKLIKNEGGLIFLVDQLMEYRRDFHDSAAILIDIGELTTNKIQEYIEEYKEMGLKVILKKVWIKESDEEKEALNFQWPS